MTKNEDNSIDFDASFEKQTKAELITSIRNLHSVISYHENETSRLWSELKEAEAKLQYVQRERDQTVRLLKSEIVDTQSKLNRALGYIDRVNEITEPVRETRMVTPTIRGPNLHDWNDDADMAMTARSEARSERPKAWFER